MSESEIEQLIKECLAQDRNAQKIFYQLFYGFAMGICLRYSNNRYEAVEIMNKGFTKVFAGDNHHYPFKAWLREIMLNTSIDYYRSQLEISTFENLNSAECKPIKEEVMDCKLNCDDLLAIIQQLPPGNRIVFNLFAIEDYSHEEIAKMLNINAEISESNLCKARTQLKEMIGKIN